MKLRKLKRIIYTVLLIIFIPSGITWFDKTQLFDLSKLAQSVSFKYDNSYELVNASIEKIVDGDTLKVEINNKSYKVRLIGIDSPESVNPDVAKNTPEGKKASNYVKTKLKIGQVVYLQSDKSDTDKYGRLLRYVWLKKPKDANDPEEIESSMLNAIIIKAGYAKAVQYKPDIRNKDIFSNLEEAAKKEKKGIWK